MTRVSKVTASSRCSSSKPQLVSNYWWKDHIAEACLKDNPDGNILTSKLCGGTNYNWAYLYFFLLPTAIIISLLRKPSVCRCGKHDKLFQPNCLAAVESCIRKNTSLSRLFNTQPRPYVDPHSLAKRFTIFSNLFDYSSLESLLSRTHSGTAWFW